MSLLVIVCGCALFAVCLAVHVVIWRTMPSKASSALLVIIFFAFPFAGFALSGAAVSAAGRTSPGGLVECAEIMLLHASLSCAYIAGYPAVRAVSPSIEIMLMIAASVNGRMAENEIVASFARAGLVEDRLEELIAYRLVRQCGGQLILLPLGRFIVGCFLLYRGVLGLPVGAG